MDRPEVDDHHNDALHRTGGGHDEGENHGEKISVLKKVKAKAKKIKDTITGHGHGHGHENDHDHDEDENEDEDEDDEVDEMDTDPDTHGGPTDTGTQLGSENQSHAVGHTPAIAQTTGSHRTGDIGAVHKPELGGTLEKDSHVPKHVGDDVHPADYQAKSSDATPGGHQRGGVLETEEMRESGKHEVILDRPTHVEKDHPAPRDVGETRHAENHQTKVADPTGSEENGATPILHQVGKMNINDDSNVKTTGQEHLFIPNSGQHQMASTGSHDQLSPEMASTGSHDQFSPESVPNPQFDSTRTSGHGFPDEVGQRPESYTEKISSIASELASKAKLATGSVTSKLGYGGSRETPTNNDSDVPGGYEESLSSISSPKTDSKSGYGVGEEQSTVRSMGDYGKKAVSTVQEKIALVSEKVAGLGSTVGSKGQGSGPEHEVRSTGRVPDKGVSVKEYLAEKLKPGEEDKALSKLITEALPLHKPKENLIPIENPINVGRGDEVRNDEIKEQASESDQAEKVVITGRVTESEEVAKRLGRSEDTDYDGAGAGLASPGKSVMDRIRDAAGSWFNKSGEPLNEADDHTGAGTERTRTSNAGDTQLNRNVGETGLQ